MWYNTKVAELLTIDYPILQGPFGGNFSSVELVAIGFSVFLLRWLGPANYGFLAMGVTAAIVLTFGSGAPCRPAGASAIAMGPPSRSRCAEVPGWTWPGEVRYSEPKTIISAPSRSARSRSPSGVDALRTTWRGTSGSPSGMWKRSMA